MEVYNHTFQCCSTYHFFERDNLLFGQMFDSTSLMLNTYSSTTNITNLQLFQDAQDWYS